VGGFVTKLVHFYHVFADGAWERPALEHVRRLANSGLLGALDEMYVGVVGSVERRREVRHKLPGVFVVEADCGWEQVTIEALRDFVRGGDGAVFYAHTKGAWSQSPLAERWREAMTASTVDDWEKCVRALGRADAAGAFWYQSGEPEHELHGHFFAGNFWWATAEYLRTLDRVRTTSRFDAEGWIGLGHPSVVDIQAGGLLPWDIR